tara:strand:+ start:940 stop:1617 length:678 start_codon:yes stop_codon:yes gene_type:complete
MNKSFLTNLISIGIIFFSFISPIYSNVFLNVGIFAFSGSLTNWLAIHMLFEKVPMFYGSGVIPKQFNEIKSAIKKLILEEFFFKENIQNFLSTNQNLNFDSVFNEEQKDRIFTKLVQAIEESSLGGMLSMVGGKNALNPLKEPMILKISEFLNDFQSNEFSIDDNTVDNIKIKIEEIVNKRLNQLSPMDVKNIIEDMIKNHLGWLVVWGGLIGGLIGFAFSLLSL